MQDSFNRRTFLWAVASLPLYAVGSSFAGTKTKRHSSLQADASKLERAKAKLEKLERELAGRLGVFALDTTNGAVFSYRAQERFPLCSTFKVLAASAILKHSLQVPGLMQRRITYQQSQLVDYSPITEKHLAQGMTVTELCAAALQYSDNTASNLLMKILGGPGSVTAFARSIGDNQFRLERWETSLNTCIPGDLRDTTTPQAMGRSLQRLVLDDALTPAHREQLRLWLCGNTTGATRIRAGITQQWQIGDKTGTGDYGTANDVGVLWPSHPKVAHRKPVVVAIYTTQPEKAAKARNDVIASAARVVSDWLQAT